MILQILLVLLLGVHGTQTDPATPTDLPATVRIKYLQGQARLSDHSCGWDFLFTCSVKGTYLIWVVNDTDLNAIHLGELPIVFNETLLDFNYTSTVLSSRAESGGQLVSILMVSVSSNANLNVRCVSNNGSNMTSNRAMTSNIVLQRNSSNGIVSMNRLWEDRPLVEVEGANSITTCYMCGVNHHNLMWETNTEEQLLLISDFVIGKEVTIRAADISTLHLQTIFFARCPKDIVAFLLVMDSSVDEVSCRAGSTVVTSSELRNEPTNPTSVSNTEDDNESINPTSVSNTEYDNVTPSSAAAITNGKLLRCNNVYPKYPEIHSCKVDQANRYL